MQASPCSPVRPFGLCNENSVKKSCDNMKNMPVFVFPVSLEFYLGARHTHKQLLTLYNPYEFPVDFKVLCTSPHKFSVMEPEGAIAAQSCIDIVVRYTQAGSSHNAGSDKFRITMLERTTHQVLGKRDIPTKLLEGEPAGAHVESVTDDFLPLITRSTPGKPVEERERPPVCSHPAHRGQQPVNYVAVFVSMCCIAALLLPTQAERPADSQLPACMHIAVNLKLVFSFVLGLVAMLVLRP